MQKKYFSLEEAKRLLPAIKSELGTLQGIKHQFEDKYMQLQQLKKVNPEHSELERTDPFFMLECEIDFLQIEAKGLIQSIHQKGAELKDIEQGLVDFPSLMNGEEVLLCWKQGEETITHYHGLYDGFAGRKPIQEFPKNV